MNRVELKSKAKEQIKGKIGVLFLITLIVGVISYVASLILSFIPVVGSLISTIIVTPAFTLSLVRVYMMVVKDEKPEVKDAFSGFDDFWAAFKVTFLVGLFTFLWSLLFIVPGIIKSISYSFAMNILAENKGKAALECINESKKMTEGHKMELFVLSLSFIGWILLCMVTLFIAYIWVGPYMQATFMNAYYSLKPVEKVEAIETEATEDVVDEIPTEE